MSRNIHFSNDKLILSAKEHALTPIPLVTTLMMGEDIMTEVDYLICVFHL